MVAGMAYLTADDLTGQIPQDWITTATDDAMAGTPDSLDAVLATVDDEINGFLEMQMTTPVSPVPQIVKTIARTLAVELFYLRRGHLENPVTKLAARQRGILEKIGTGQLKLGAPATPPEQAAPVGQPLGASAQTMPSPLGDPNCGIMA